MKINKQRRTVLFTTTVLLVISFSGTLSAQSRIGNHNHSLHKMKMKNRQEKLDMQNMVQKMDSIKDRTSDLLEAITNKHEVRVEIKKDGTKLDNELIDLINSVNNMSIIMQEYLINVNIISTEINDSTDLKTKQHLSKLNSHSLSVMNGIEKIVIDVEHIYKLLEK
jgi:hypothetical protein